jgi:hypothetical protein
MPFAFVLLRPPLNHHFRIGKELENLSSVPFDVPKQRPSGSTEGEEGHGRGDSQIDPQHAGSSTVLKLPGRLSVRRV